MEDRILPTRSGESVVFMGGTLENGWHVGMQGMQGQAYRQESTKIIKFSLVSEFFQYPISDKIRDTVIKTCTVDSVYQ